MRELGLGKHGELGNRSDTCHTSWVGGRGLYRSHLGIEMRHSINVFIQQLYLRVKSEKDKAPWKPQWPYGMLRTTTRLGTGFRRPVGCCHL